MHRLQRRSSRKCLTRQGLAVRDCNAVCVSMGPGSYTGLRVGVSTAKGLCFGAGLPLLAVGSLDTLVWQAIGEKLLPEGCKYIVPMIDARRMEVYTAVFTPDGKQVSETEPKVIDNESFADILAEVRCSSSATRRQMRGNDQFCQCQFRPDLSEGRVNAGSGMQVAGG